MDSLAGRERELAAVDELLEGGGAVLLVEGGAGVGKTPLLEAACARAEGVGHEVLRARGSELEAGFAFGVVRQLFERRLVSAAESEREAMMAGPAGAVRPLLLGEPVEDRSLTRRLPCCTGSTGWRSISPSAGRC